MVQPQCPTELNLKRTRSGLVRSNKRSLNGKCYYVYPHIVRNLLDIDLNFHKTGSLPLAKQLQLNCCMVLLEYT